MSDQSHQEASAEHLETAHESEVINENAEQAIKENADVTNIQVQEEAPQTIAVHEETFDELHTMAEKQKEDQEQELIDHNVMNEPLENMQVEEPAEVLKYQTEQMQEKRNDKLQKQKHEQAGGEGEDKFISPTKSRKKLTST